MSKKGFPQELEYKVGSLSQGNHFMKIPIQEHSNIVNQRGRLLSSAIMIEGKLEKLLIILMKSEYYDSKDFGEKLWRKRNVDFNVKFEMLRVLSNSHILINKDKDDWKTLRQKLKNVIEVRNRFAHGQIYYEREKPHIRYVRKDNEQTDELTDNYWESSISLFHETVRLLKQLEKKLISYMKDTN